VVDNRGQRQKWVKTGHVLVGTQQGKGKNDQQLSSNQGEGTKKKDQPVIQHGV